MKTNQTVVVLFQVRGDDQASAQRVVEERLEGVQLLRQNDSTDFARGTEDPINTYVVVPAEEMFDEAI